MAVRARPTRERSRKYTSRMEPTATPSARKYVPGMRVSIGSRAADRMVMPEPPPVAWMLATMSRTTSATTHVPMAK